MQNKFRLTFIFMLIGLTACQPLTESKKTEDQVNKNETTLSSAQQKGQEVLNKCIEAHGGLNRWNSFEGIEYDLINKGKKVYQLTHLSDRRAYLKGEGFEVGFDGKVAWAKPDASQVAGKSAAFYFNLDFYFVGIPFVLKDPGVNVTYEGKTIINGRGYETLKITYGEGVGVSPEDIYYTYIDPETYMLEVLVYSVTYFDKSRSESFGSAKLYADYKDIQGLKMPHRLENYSWEKGVMGEETKFERQVENILFLPEIPQKERFEVPEGAVVEEI